MMPGTARTTIFVPAAPEVVFDVFTNHQTYPLLAGVKGTRLITPGHPEPGNGRGAIREIDLGFASFQEQVTDVRRPDYWDYHFIAWPLPLTHMGGRMGFEAVPGGTRVTWESTIAADGLRGAALPALIWLNSGGLKLLAWQMKRIVLRGIRQA